MKQYNEENSSPADPEYKMFIQRLHAEHEALRKLLQQVEKHNSAKPAPAEHSLTNPESRIINKFQPIVNEGHKNAKPLIPDNDKHLK